MATKTFKIGLSATDKQNMAQDIYERLLDLTFDEYDSSETYNTGDFVVYNDVLYQCKEDNVTGTWDSSKWEQATLQDLLDDVEDAVSQVNDKANVDGNYPTMTVGLADNLTPYSEDSGAEQDNPFISNGTGTNNNTEIVTVGDYGLLKSKNGNTLVVNQQLQNPRFSSNSNWVVNASNATLSISSGIAKAECSADGDIALRPQVAINTIANHKYLVHARVRTSGKAVLLSTAYSQTEPSTTSTSFVDLYMIGSRTSDFSGVYPQLRTSNAVVGDYFEVSCFELVDLTQMFNGDIPQDLLDNPDHLSWYYNGDLSYNTGTLVNANGVKLVSTGRNIYNPDETYNVVIPNKPFFVSKTTTITYYDKDKNSIGTEIVSAGNTFTTPSNCVFINSSVSSITITHYYTDQEGGEGYLDSNNVPIEYPYEAPYEVDTGSEVLRSAGSVYDYKEPSGTIHRVIKNDDLSQFDWTSVQFDGITYWRTYSILSLAKTFSGKPNLICDKYINISNYSGVAGMTNKTIMLYTDGALWLRDDSITQASEIAGTIYYELATPTTEQGTSFSENLPINDYGMLYWDNTNGVPQGATIFFPVNYKGFVDDMYSKVDGDSSDYALNSELNAKFETYLKTLTGYDATKTQTLKNVEGTLTWVDDE